MAGDWIKVEKCSPDKPEVMRLASLWGVPKDQAFGAIIRFWIWLDNASVDGRVDGVASQEIDDMMRFQGFAQGLASVGWLKIDDSTPKVIIPNFDKHNSQTSKKRALSSDRQAKWRNAHVDASSVTNALPEKRRIDIKTKPIRAKPSAFALPDWIPKDAWQEWERHRRGKLTDLARKRQVKKLDDLRASGYAVEDLIGLAVERGWSTFFEPKPEKQNGKHAAGAWWDSEQGILAKGKELDMTPYGGEGWPEFKARINQRLRAQSGSR